MVLDAGELSEFDTPAALLQTPGSIFASMVEDTGPENAKHLRQVCAVYHISSAVSRVGVRNRRCPVSESTT